MTAKPKVGEILVEAGVIDASQLASALGEQKRWGRRLGMTLIKLGMVEEGHLVRALAKQLDLPVANLSGKTIADDVLALVPLRVATEHGVVPLFVKREGGSDQLYLGMEDPSDLGVLEDLRLRTRMEVRPVMMGPTEVGEAIDRNYLTRPRTASASPVSRDPVGEGNIRAVAEDAEPRSLDAPIADSRVESEYVGNLFASGDDPIELDAPATALLASLIGDVTRATQESDKARDVTKAIALLLIEKGILTLEELQAQIVQQKTDESS